MKIRINKVPEGTDEYLGRWGVKTHEVVSGNLEIGMITRIKGRDEYMAWAVDTRRSLPLTREPVSDWVDLDKAKSALRAFLSKLP